MNQLTIAKKITCSGIGLHKGSQVFCELAPLSSGSGVVFYRRDLGRYYEARSKNVINTQMATVIGDEHGQINTIEHLMSALAAYGIDNILITLDANETPVFDGSAATWCALLDAASIMQNDAPKELIAIKRAIIAKNENKFAKLSPCTSCAQSYDFTIDFAHPAINKQHFYFEFSRQAYLEQIAPARTFGFLREVEALKARGLALGGSLENAVVLDDASVLNPEGLRFCDEFVRHKILDAIGDMYMLGYGLLGSYSAFASSHGLNHTLCEQIRANSANYELICAKHAREFILSLA